MKKLGGVAWAVVVAVLSGLANDAARAQAPAAVKADGAAEAAAAMERAKRLASNPMRVILDAGKVRRKGAVDELPLEAADAASLRRTSTRGNNVVAEPAPLAKQVADASTAPAPAVLPRAAPAEPAIGVTRSRLGALKESVSTLEAIGPALAPTASLAQAPTALSAPLAIQPKLVESVEPVFSGRHIEEASRLTEVLAELTVRPDGAVVQVELLGGVPRVLQRPIIAALEQWRFAPLPAQQTHRVQLVFGGGK